MDRGHRHGGLLARTNRSGHAAASDTEAWFLRPLIFPSAATKDQSGCLAMTQGQFCWQRLASKRQNGVQIKVAHVFFQTCPWICLWSENAVFVGLLGSPLLARDAQNSGRLLAPVPFAIPKHAVCERRRNAWLRVLDRPRMLGNTGGSARTLE